MERKKTMRIKSIITATALLLMSSCKEQSRTLIFALDYSKSTGVDRISKMEEILSVAKPGDKVIVYPVHGRTASATPIAEQIIPPCEDINCERQRSNILKVITSEIDKNFKKSKLLQNSQIFATVVEFSLLRATQNHPEINPKDAKDLNIICATPTAGKVLYCLVTRSPSGPSHRHNCCT